MELVKAAAAALSTETPHSPGTELTSCGLTPHTHHGTPYGVALFHGKILAAVWSGKEWIVNATCSIDADVRVPALKLFASSDKRPSFMHLRFGERRYGDTIEQWAVKQNCLALFLLVVYISSKEPPTDLGDPDNARERAAQLFNWPEERAEAIAA